MGGAYWRNLVKTAEPTMCGGDVALCHCLPYYVLFCCVWAFRGCCFGKLFQGSSL